jgi:hypothetical protein
VILFGGEYSLRTVPAARIDGRVRVLHEGIEHGVSQSET